MGIAWTLARCLVIGAAILAAALTPAATAAAKGRNCRETCGLAISTCVEQGFRPHFCAREVMTLCKRGSTMCHTTSTTIPVCVTTTTLPPPSGECLGPAGCALDPSGITSTIPSAEALRERLLGVWYDCKKDPMPAAPFAPDAAGIEFASDGSWYFLRDDGGTLVQETGFGQAGTYDIIDTSSMNGPGHFQLNLTRNTGSLVILQWTLSAQPQQLLLNDYGQQALYSHMPGSPACPQ